MSPEVALRSATTAGAVVHLTNLPLLSFLQEEKHIRIIGVPEVTQPGLSGLEIAHC